LASGCASLQSAPTPNPEEKDVALSQTPSRTASTARPSLFSTAPKSDKDFGEDTRILSVLEETGVVKPSRARRSRWPLWAAGGIALSVVATGAVLWTGTPDVGSSREAAPAAHSALKAVTVAASSPVVATQVAVAASASAAGATVETVAPAPAVTALPNEAAASSASAPSSTPLALLAEASPASAATPIKPAPAPKGAAHHKPSTANHAGTAIASARHDAHRQPVPAARRTPKQDDADVDLLEAMVARMRKPSPANKAASSTLVAP
jgi:hypothetical protein